MRVAPYSPAWSTRSIAATSGRRSPGRQAGLRPARGRFRLSHRITNAAEMERIAFQPAIEMPSTDRPLHLVAADQRRLHDRLEEIVAAAARRGGALGEPLPQIELDAGMEDADRAAGEDAERRQPDEAAAAIGHPRPRAGRRARRRGREMGVTLPVAHLAGGKAAPILRAVGAGEQGRGHEQGQRLGRPSGSGHRGVSGCRRAARRRRRRPAAAAAVRPSRAMVWTA